MSFSRASCYFTIIQTSTNIPFIGGKWFQCGPFRDMSKFQPPLNGLVSFKTSQSLYFLCHSSPQIMHPQQAVKKCQEKIKSLFINSKNWSTWNLFPIICCNAQHPFVGIDLRQDDRIGGLKGSTFGCLFPLASQLSINKLHLYAMLVLNLPSIRLILLHYCCLMEA